jgi:hypothetical protein
MWFLESLDGWTCNVRIGKIACWSWDGRPKCPFSNKYLVIVGVFSRVVKVKKYGPLFVLKVSGR